MLNICARLQMYIKNTSSHLKKRDTERTRNTDRICMILNCDLELKSTLLKHALSTSANFAEHLRQVTVIQVM